jgi:hypothetical protein
MTRAGVMHRRAVVGFLLIAALVALFLSAAAILGDPSRPRWLAAQGRGGPR